MKKDKNVQDIMDKCWNRLESLVRSIPQKSQVDISFLKTFNSVLDILDNNPECGYKDLTEYRIPTNRPIEKDLYKQKVTEFYLYFVKGFNISQIQHPLRDYLKIIIWSGIVNFIKKNRKSIIISITTLVLGLIIDIFCRKIGIL